MSWFTNTRNSRQAVKCLTEGCAHRAYIPLTDWLFERIHFGLRMKRKIIDTDVPAYSFKNDSARQRWELFHRAIAHAKQTNLDAMDKRDGGADEHARNVPLMSIVR